MGAGGVLQTLWACAVLLNVWIAVARCQMQTNVDDIEPRPPAIIPQDPAVDFGGYYQTSYNGELRQASYNNCCPENSVVLIGAIPGSANCFACTLVEDG